jgi:hypothetical protein
MSLFWATLSASSIRRRTGIHGHVDALDRVGEDVVMDLVQELCNQPSKGLFEDCMRHTKTGRLERQ